MREQKNKYIFSIFENNFLMAPSERMNENIKSVFQVFNLDTASASPWRVLIERNDKTFSDLRGQVTMTMDFGVEIINILGFTLPRASVAANDENSQEIASLNSNLVFVVASLGK